VAEEEKGEEMWSGRLGFLLAAIGSAIGLGAVWRYPYLVYEYGGGAFLIPFLIALFVSGIPLMILELGVGKTFRTSAPFAFMRVNKKMAWVGWATLMIGFVIISYYTVVLAWSLVYMFYSPKLAWGGDPQGFFNNEVVHLSSGPGAIGGISIAVLVMVIITWIVIYLIVVKGIKMVSKVVMLTVPAPYILMTILAFFTLRLHGADVGLEYYLRPDFHALINPEVWLAAFAQIFFALSLSTGVMIAYSSRLERKADVVNNAYIVSFLDIGYAFFAGIVVFSTLGYMASAQGVPMSEVVSGGPGLAFATYPTAISMLPSGAATFGVLFFLMLFTLGIDSAFATIEAVALGLKDAGLNYKRVSLAICVLGGGLAALFATGGGYHWFWIVDNFFNEVGIVTMGILECFIIGYLYDPNNFVKDVNETSELHVGRFWVYCIKYITPGILVVMLVAKLIKTATSGFEGYPLWSLLAGGLLPLIVIGIVGVYMSRRWPGRD